MAFTMNTHSVAFEPPALFRGGHRGTPECLPRRYGTTAATGTGSLSPVAVVVVGPGLLVVFVHPRGSQSPLTRNQFLHSTVRPNNSYWAPGQTVPAHRPLDLHDVQAAVGLRTEVRQDFRALALVVRADLLPSESLRKVNLTTSTESGRNLGLQGTEELVAAVSPSRSGIFDDKPLSQPHVGLRLDRCR